MVSVVAYVIIVDVVVVLGVVVGDGEIVVPEKERVIWVAVIGCKKVKLALEGLVELLTIHTYRTFCNHHRSSDNLFAFQGSLHIDVVYLDIHETHPRML